MFESALAILAITARERINVQRDDKAELILEGGGKELASMDRKAREVMEIGSNNYLTCYLTDVFSDLRLREPETLKPRRIPPRSAKEGSVLG